MSHLSIRILRTTAFAVLTCSLWAGSSAAGEPAERFIKQLRAAGYFEIANVYLDRISQYPGVSGEFLEAIDLERAQNSLEASQQSRVMDDRDALIAKASEALQRFVTQKPSHPRRSEAQMQLGKIQLARGVQLIELGGPPTPERRQTAKQTFLDASKTFGAIVTELREELLKLQGQKIDAQKQPELVTRRDTYRASFLESLLNQAEAIKRAAEAIGEDTPERKTLAEDALKQFTELTDKYSDKLAGILAILYAGELHDLLGDDKAATDKYLAVLDQPDSDVLRKSKAKATTGLMRISLRANPPDFQAAIERGQPWADDIRPDEKQSNEFNEMRLVLADAYLGKRAGTENGTEQRRLASSARALLLPISKSAGPMQEAASEKLATLGVGDADNAIADDSKPLPNSFSESLSLANDILDEEKNLTLTSQLLEQRAAEGEQIAAELGPVKDSLSKLRSRGIQVLRHTLNLTTPETSNAEVNQARASLAFLLFRSGRYREAAVVGEFVARRYPSSELAVSSGLTALGSWQLALREAEEAQTDGILRQLQSTAEYLVGRWPEDSQIASAKELLVRVAIGRNDFDAATKFLDQLPGDNPSRMELQQAMGRLMWNKAITLKNEGDLTAAQAMRNKAAETLSSGLQKLNKEAVTGTALEAALLLARVQVLNDNSKAALATLESDVYGPLKRIDEVPVSSETFKGELYGLALQVMVAELTSDGADVNTLMDRSKTVMSGLQQAYQGQPEGDKKLVATYFQLARDIREQLESAPPAKKQRLTDAFKLLLDQLSSQSDDSKTLHWAAQTLLGLGQGAMGENDAKATGQAETLVSSASALLKRIESRGAKEPSWLASEQMLTQVRLELGTAARLVGDYKTALDSLTAVLEKNQMLVDAQVEAALVYEQWAGALQNPQFASVSYGRAISGAKPDASGKNVIWGWGSIAKRTMGNPQFDQVFFNARYRLALCRFLQGKKEANPEKAKKIFEQAAGDVRAVVVRYPEMGGPASRQKFDLLTKEIQKALGSQPLGLAEFASPTS
jgi:tetratricopeptide (TPR) repeat protein